MKKDYFIHPSSFIEKNVKIGRGTKIWHFCHIMDGVRIGKECKTGQNVYIDKGVKIGNNCKIGNNVSVFKKVTLEDDVFCGPSMIFTNVINPRSKYPRKIEEYKKTLVKKGATIGANATIVCGNTLGCHSFIGAGSVVTKDVPSYAIVYGNPARIKGWMCECGEKLEFKDGISICRKCKKKYNKKGEKIERVK